MPRKFQPSKCSALSLSAFAASAIVVSVPSFAQAPLVEEILVTGEKIERSIQDTASSVAVFTETQISESAIYDVQDVFDRLANVNGAQGGEGFSIRGINDRAVGATGTSSLSSFHIDNAIIDRRGVQAGQKDLWDVNQIEVFRGSQSTSQGRNSLAGAIFVRTTDPTYEADGQYRVGFGTDNTRITSIAYGNAIIDDVLAFRISIDDQSTDGFITNEFLDDDTYGDSSNTTIRGKLLFEPSDDLSFLLTLSHSENSAGDVFSSTIDAQGNAIDPFDARVFANVEGIEDLDQSIATSEINYEINDVWSFTSISSWNEADFVRQDDDDRQATSGIAARNRTQTAETLSQEFRFNFDGENTRGVLGAYYFDKDSSENIDDFLAQEIRDSITAQIQQSAAGALAAGLVDEATAGALDAAAPLVAGLYDDPFFLQRDGLRDQSIENYAVFGNIEYDVSDLLTVFAGVRYDNEDVSNSLIEERPLVSELPEESDLLLPGALEPFSALVASQTIPLVNQQIIGLTQVDTLDNNKTNFSAFLPKAGLTLNWTDDLSNSFTVQRAYRAGGSGTTSLGNYEYDPEFTTNYELAFRSQWLDNRLTANANLFYIDWTDQQVNVIDTREGGSSEETIVVNAAESSVKGFELELNYIASSQLQTYASFGYVDTEFDDFDLSEQEIGTASDLSGNEFNNAPNLTASAGLQYDFSTSLSLQTDLNYQEKSFDGAENTTESDSRTIANAKLTYRVNSALEFALVGRNIFDKEYLLRDDEFGTNTVLIGQPRTVLLQVQGKF